MPPKSNKNFNINKNIYLLVQKYSVFGDVATVVEISKFDEILRILVLPAYFIGTYLLYNVRKNLQTDIYICKRFRIVPTSTPSYC